MIFLATYHPLVESKAGRDAIARYGCPPFVDASCRREPDLEHEYPSITALCRASMFAPRLHVGDVAVYITAKGDYLNFGKGHWRLTAVLQVLERCETHEEAAEWYLLRDLPLPRNCIVEDNDPLPLDMTVACCSIDGKKQSPHSVEEWDQQYRARARENGVFLICKPLFRELHRPPILTEQDAIRTFGAKGMPDTQTPPSISPAEFEGLMKACRLRIALNE